MNANKLLSRIVRRKLEAVEQTIAEAELAGDITATDAQALRGDACRILEVISAGAGLVDRTGGRASSEEKEIMKLVSGVLEESEMEEGGAMWRTCIRGSHGHPPRPGKVRRVFETLRSELAEGKAIDNKSKYAWWLYKQFAD